MRITKRVAPIIVGAIFCFVLSGCSTSVTLVEEGSEHAVLSGKKNIIGSFNWQQMFIHKINGMRVPINYDAPIPIYDLNVHISPGIYQVEVGAEYYHRGWPKIAFGTVSLQVKASRKYHPVMKIEENIVTLWIVDADSEEIVSNISEPYDGKDRIRVIPL